MIAVSWRQFRAQAVVGAAALVAVAVALAVTGPHLVDVYRSGMAQCRAQGTSGSNCDNPVLDTYRGLQIALAALVLVAPALLGMFWGAPLMAREIESGTYRLAWTQSVTRRHWVLVKLGVVALGAMAAAGALSLMATWWSSPLVTASQNRFSPGEFGLVGIVPVGYAAFAFALGATTGLVLRRTLPAMATTLAGFIAARLAMTYWIRPHLMTPLRRVFSLTGPGGGVGVEVDPQGLSLVAQAPSVPNAWVFSTSVQDAAGNAPSTAYLQQACPNLPGIGGSVHHLQGPGLGGAVSAVPVPGGLKGDLQQCIATVATRFHEVALYQPASRYWAFQWLETLVFVVVAALLAGGAYWWVRHRMS